MTRKILVSYHGISSIDSSTNHAADVIGMFVTHDDHKPNAIRVNISYGDHDTMWDRNIYEYKHSNDTKVLVDTTKLLDYIDQRHNIAAFRSIKYMIDSGMAMEAPRLNLQSIAKNSYRFTFFLKPNDDMMKRVIMFDHKLLNKGVETETITTDEGSSFYTLVQYAEDDPLFD